MIMKLQGRGRNPSLSATQRTTVNNLIPFFASRHYHVLANSKKIQIVTGDLRNANKCPHSYASDATKSSIQFRIPMLCHPSIHYLLQVSQSY